MTTHVNPRKTLTPRQELFCHHLFSGKTATESASIAGYAPGNCDKLLKTTRISQKLAQLKAKLESETMNTIVADSREIGEKLTEILRSPFDPDDVMITHRLTAADILNKMARVYLDTAPREGEVYNTVVFVLPDGTRLEPNQLIKGTTCNEEGEVLELAPGAPDDDTTKEEE